MIEDVERDDGFEVTFVVATPRPEAWARLTDAAPARDALPPPRPGQWWLPGHEGPADPIEVVSGKRAHLRKATEPCKGSEVVVTMEDEGTGTRITVVQYGFGPGFDERRPWLEAGWWAIRADLYLWFDRGVAAGRHVRPWSTLAAGVSESPAGLLVGDVAPAGYADQAGMRPGDLVLTLAGVPVVTVRELAVLLRAFRTGTEVKARYVRGNEVLTGTGSL